MKELAADDNFGFVRPVVTSFGKYIRNIRIENGQTLGEMAEHIGVSSAYLSSAEFGKVPVTSKMIEGILTIRLACSDAINQMARLNTKTGEITKNGETNRRGLSCRN